MQKYKNIIIYSVAFLDFCVALRVFCVALVSMRHLYIKIVTCILVYVMMNSPQKHNSRVILSKLFYNFAS